jgi:phenylacetate-coenzyme A ligase PaaK-like adenylate-forming protein
MLATPEIIEESAQPHHLAAVLPRWIEAVPLYAQPHTKTFADKSRSELELLRDFPLLTKEEIRDDFPRNFLGPEAELDALTENQSIELEHTSGTSEERTPLLLPRGWWAEQERRALLLNPVVAKLLTEEPDARRVTISSPACSSEVCYTGVPSRDERTVGNTLFLSLSRFPFLWSQQELARMAAETVQWQPRFLDLDPVYGVVFALYCERHHVRIPSLAFIVCTYEYVSVVHRGILQRVFGVPVFDLYGSTETGHLLMEDAAGQMRPSLQTALLELINTDELGIAELVVTTLSNDLMPLIRYRIGDLVEKLELPFGSRYVLHGRVADAFRTTREQRVTTRQVDQCFVGVSGIGHYQLQQRRTGAWVLRYVPDGRGPTAESLNGLRSRLSIVLELKDEVKLERTDLLLAGGSGKFQLCYPEGSTS